MSRIDEIQGEICSLNNQISEYEDNISELLEVRDYIVGELQRVEDVSSEIRAYDTTKGDQWLGNLNLEMQDNKDYISRTILTFSMQTENFINSIYVAVGRLRAMINDCKGRICELESQMSEFADVSV
ncbi:YwqH-like family protein [Butyrivibrio sp. INlla14]|uniref:YwqH-like family protein n=1 Tax=Butyrivibrio sp. INlla14 TaxID=1520808 RepID=UPI0008765F0F|nr:DUF5082 family protein [Butyrivibrio sp. INlla14]SCY40308.1 protein of unknown function [Butyrivibrio sp. INlla14]